MTGDRWMRELSERDARAHTDTKGALPPEPGEGLFVLLLLLLVSTAGLVIGFALGYVLGTAYRVVAG